MNIEQKSRALLQQIMDTKSATRLVWISTGKQTYNPDEAHAHLVQSTKERAINIINLLLGVEREDGYYLNNENAIGMINFIKSWSPRFLILAMTHEIDMEGASHIVDFNTMGNIVERHASAQRIYTLEQITGADGAEKYKWVNTQTSKEYLGDIVGNGTICYYYMLLK